MEKDKQQNPFDPLKAMDDFTEIMNRPNETMSDAFKKMNAAKEFFLGIYNKGFQEGHEVAMKKLEL